MNIIRKLVRLDHLNDEESNNIIQLIKEHADFLFLMINYKPLISQHTITTVDETPIYITQYRYPPVHKINKQIHELLNNDIIEPSNSPYNSPL